MTRDGADAIRACRYFYLVPTLDRLCEKSVSRHREVSSRALPLVFIMMTLANDQAVWQFAHVMHSLLAREVCSIGCPLSFGVDF
jgi:hypothetical protein